jgi:hypothetical protein
MKALLAEIWIPGQAAEMSIYLTPKEVATEMSLIRAENFKTKAEYERFLRTSHLTRRDAHELVRIQMLSSLIKARVIRGVDGKKARRRVLARFVARYVKRWRSRTVCAAGYVFAQCSDSGDTRAADMSSLDLRGDTRIGMPSVRD